MYNIKSISIVRRRSRANLDLDYSGLIELVAEDGRTISIGLTDANCRIYLKDSLYQLAALLPVDLGYSTDIQVYPTESENLTPVSNKSKEKSDDDIPF